MVNKKIYELRMYYVGQSIESSFEMKQDAVSWSHSLVFAAESEMESCRELGWTVADSKAGDLHLKRKLFPRVN